MPSLNPSKKHTVAQLSTSKRHSAEPAAYIEVQGCIEEGEVSWKRFTLRVEGLIRV